MKVGINATVLKNPVTGVAKRLIWLIKEIHQANRQIEFILFSHLPIQLPGLALPKVRRVITPSLNEFTWLHLKIPYLLIQHQIDLFDAPWGGGLPFLFDAYFTRNPIYRKIKFVTTIHDLIPLARKSTKISGINRFFFSYKILANLKMAHRVAVVSRVTEIQLKELIQKKSRNSLKDLESKLFISPNGVDPIFLSDYSDDLSSQKWLNRIQNSRTIYGEQPSSLHRIPPYILYLGGFNQRKNIENLLLAFEAQINPAWLVLAGHLNQYFSKKIHPLIKKRKIDHIILTGYLEEELLPIFYHHSQCLVYPSLLEGFGMPVLEGLMTGTPCIVHHQVRKNLPEWPNQDHLLKTADLRHKENLSKLLQATLAQKKKKNPNGDESKRLTHYHWKNIARNYNRVYQDLTISNSPNHSAN